MEILFVTESRKVNLTLPTVNYWKYAVIQLSRQDLFLNFLILMEILLLKY